MKRLWILLIVFALVATPAMAKKKAAEEPGEEKMTRRCRRRPFPASRCAIIGPAINSGRVSDFAVHPDAHHIIYVATASGGLWKTVNAGTTWEPIFDKEKSYSIGCVTLDPTNPNVVWVGTGENNSQRSVAFGDGVYKSLDGGQNWENVGSSESEHIGMIAIDPRDSNVVYVAARARCGGRAATAASTRPPTAARPGNASSTSPTTPASTRSTWTRAIPTCSTPRPTSAGATSGP